LNRLEPRYEALQAGTFDSGGWSAAQRTTGRTLVVEVEGGSVTGKGLGVDPETGALLVQSDFGERVHVQSGEVLRCRVV
jgi:biotin-(acetyl-CoA carboxylase) ligase